MLNLTKKPLQQTDLQMIYAVWCYVALFCYFSSTFCPVLGFICCRSSTIVMYYYDGDDDYDDGDVDGDEDGNDNDDGSDDGDEDGDRDMMMMMNIIIKISYFDLQTND